MKGTKKNAIFNLYPVLVLSCYIALAGWLSSCQPNSGGGGVQFKSIHISYPSAFRDSVQADSFHGVVVRDPYRWMEYQRDRRLNKWIQDQRSIAGQYFQQIDYRETIRSRMRSLEQYEHYALPDWRGDKYFVWKNNGGQQQDVLHKTTGMFGKLQSLLDPNAWSKDGSLSANGYAFSRDGSLLAYGISQRGSSLADIYIIETNSGRKLRDTIKSVKNPVIAWFQDGFFYSRYPANGVYRQISAPDQFHQLYYHKIGDRQSQDALVFADRSYPRRNVKAVTSEDERYLILFLEESYNGCAVMFRDLEAGDGDFTPIIETFDHHFRFIGNKDNKLLFLTTHEAPNGRIVAVNTGRPGERYWDDLVPHNKNVVLQHAVLADGKLVCSYLRTEGPQMAIYDLKGKLQHHIDLEAYTSVLGLKARSDGKEVFAALGHFLQPTRIAWINMADYKLSSYFAPKIDFKAGQCEINKVEYESFDGQKIPLWLIHKKGLAPDGKRPTLLLANGGGGSSALPEYNAYLAFVVENDGVCAIACIRGGSEGGETWRQWGALGKKQNAFDDFQSAAQYLISNLYTSKEKLAIMGRGHGAMIVGGAITQRPDLCQAAVAVDGIYDMMRYQHFYSGWLWAGEFGRSEIGRQFDNLLSYSPLHNAVPAKYPAVLIAASDEDDNILPAHSYKMTATLQAMQQNNNPVLIRLNRGGPYPAGAPATRRLDEAADIAAFIWYNLQENLSTPRR